MYINIYPWPSLNLKGPWYATKRKFLGDALQLCVVYMSSIDVRQVIKMSPSEREKFMSQVFSQLMGLSREQVVSALVDFIKQLSSAATDEQYKEVCKTNVGIIAQLPEAAAKAVVQMRLEAQSRLPPGLRERDQRLLNQAIAESPYRDKIMSLLK